MKSLKVKVKLFSIIRLRVGTSELDLEIPENSTVQDLLDYLEKKYERQLKKDFKSKNGHYNFSISVNGQNYGLSVRLKDGDIVALITPISGG